MEEFVKFCKDRITHDDLESLQDAFQTAIQDQAPYAWEYVYQKLYLHACLKKKQSIVDWLTPLFSMLDPIQQIALRQLFSYGRYLLAH